MSRAYTHVLSFAVDHPWAITPSMLEVIAGILAGRMAGVHATEADIAAALVNRRNLPQATSGGGIAVIPIYGVIAPRANLMSDMSGGTSYQKLGGQLNEALGNKAVKSIVLDIDSPGGSVAGATEFARQVMAARTRKPIYAVAQYQCCSAAYWIAACATEVIAAPSALVGSIGVYGMHDDLSKALEAAGITRTYVSAGDGKVDGNETAPLSDEARARLEGVIGQYFSLFVGDVVKGRGAGMTADRVKKEWKAHVYSAPDAQRHGLIDGVATLEDTLTRLSTPATAAAARAQLDATVIAKVEEPATAKAEERSPDINWTNAALGGSWLSIW